MCVCVCVCVCVKICACVGFNKTDICFFIWQFILFCIYKSSFSDPWENVFFPSQKWICNLTLIFWKSLLDFDKKILSFLSFFHPFFLIIFPPFFLLLIFFFYFRLSHLPNYQNYYRIAAAPPPAEFRQQPTICSGNCLSDVNSSSHILSQTDNSMWYFIFLKSSIWYVFFSIESGLSGVV